MLRKPSHLSLRQLPQKDRLNRIKYIKARICSNVANVTRFEWGTGHRIRTPSKLTAHDMAIKNRRVVGMSRTSAHNCDWISSCQRVGTELSFRAPPNHQEHRGPRIDAYAPGCLFLIYIVLFVTAFSQNLDTCDVLVMAMQPEFEHVGCIDCIAHNYETACGAMLESELGANCSGGALPTIILNPSSVIFILFPLLSASSSWAMWSRETRPSDT